MRISIFVSSKSPECRRLEAFLKNSPGHQIPLIRIETKEAAQRVKNSAYPISTVPTLLLVDGPGEGDRAGNQRARMWVGYDKIVEFLSAPPAQGPERRVSRVMDSPRGEPGRDGPVRASPRDDPRPRPRPQPRPRPLPEEDPYDEPDEEEPYEEPPPPPKRKRKTTVATPKQRKAASRRLREAAEEEDEEGGEALSGRELAARKAAAARSVKKPPSKMDDVIARAKREQAEARKSLPYDDKNFLS